MRRTLRGCPGKENNRKNLNGFYPALSLPAPPYNHCKRRVRKRRN